jgi:hypothetical protein
LFQLKCNLREYNKTFPNAKYANIRNRHNISGDDFKYLSKVEILDMSLCIQSSINDRSFRYLSNIRDLNLQGACGHWIGHHFTDSIFDHFSNLERLYIDENHVITNEGIKKLISIKDLTIHNCMNIGDDGLLNLTTLEKLNIYNLNKLTDNAFVNLTNIVQLDMTFGNISDVGICHLTKIQILNFLSCEKIKCVNYNKLLELESISICDKHITDDDLISLSDIPNVSLYGCNIDGNGLKYLTNCYNISIYKSDIIDKNLDHLLKLININQINIYRCKLISREKKSELKSVFGKKFNTD